jgi:uncharacterized membrane protein
VTSAAPLHPILVHFSVALTTAAALFDFAGLVFHRDSLADAAWWTLALAALLTIGTVVTGIRSRLTLPLEEGPARSYLRTHMALGPMFLGLLLATTIWRARLWEQGGPVSIIYVAAMGALLLLLAVVGWIGGELVFRFGAAVQGQHRYPPMELPASDSDRPQVPTH